MAQVTLGEQFGSPPTDGISRVRFSTSSDLLLVSSWDMVIRIYDGPSTSLVGTFQDDAPVLDCCWQDDTVFFSGGLDCQVKRYDVASGQHTVLGSHDKSVKVVEYVQSPGYVVSCSWDESLKVWDPRASPPQNCVGHLQLPGRAFTASIGGHRLVVGTSGRQVLVYDLRLLGPQNNPLEQQRESSLKYQTRCITCYPDGQGYALASVEGRVAMEYFDSSAEVQAKKYAFKCHRRTDNGKDVVYPVNTIAFHPSYGTFATGGGDGVVNIWDGLNKKRLFQLSSYPTSISSLDFSRDGSYLVIASSYQYEFGERDHPKDALYVRQMQEVEVKPKPRK